MADQIRFCPNCGSTDVEPDTTNAAAVSGYGGTPNQWKCNNCNYSGMMPEGDPEKDYGSEPAEDVDSDPESGENIDFEPDEKYSRENIKFGGKWVKFVVIPAIVLSFLFLLISFI